MSQVIDLPVTLPRLINNLSVETPGRTTPATFSPVGYQRVILVSSHPLFRVGLRSELSHCPEFKVVGEAEDALEVLDLCEQERVNLVVIDQVRPGDALPLIKAVQAGMGRRIPLVVLGSTETEAQIDRLRELGVAAYASKALEGAQLCQIFQRAIQHWRPQPGIRSQVESRPQPVPPVRKPRSGFKDQYPLSPREMQILGEIAQGRSNKEVAQVLCISSHTLKNHLNNIFKKLEVEDRTQALMLGVRNGWVRI